MRSALSVLGLGVAIAGMVGLFSVAGGINQLVQSTFDQINGLVVQQRGAPFPLFSTLPAEWRKDLEAVPGVAVVNAEILARVNVMDGKEVLSPPRFFLGVDLPSRLQLKHGVYDERMTSGRFLTADDIGTRNCIISRQIAEKLNKQVGDSFVANAVSLQIVGIYDCKSIMLDVNILLDLTTLRKIARFDTNSVNSFYVEGDGTVGNKELGARIEAALRGREVASWQPSLASGLLAGRTPGLPVVDLLSGLARWVASSPGLEAPLSENAANHGTDGINGTDDGSANSSLPDAAAAPDLVAPAEEETSPVEVRTSEEWTEKFDDFSGDLKLFLTLITAIGVTIAVLSILNTMLMSVSERTVEFGILRANGWTKRDVTRLITCESGALGLIGGLIGSLVGVLATHILNWWFPDRLHLHAGISLVLFAIAFSSTLGILGGVYPAYLAVRMSPMQAIRRS